VEHEHGPFNELNRMTTVYAIATVPADVRFAEIRKMVSNRLDAREVNGKVLGQRFRATRRHSAAGLF
jgi:hypothetical protein